jgi:hypothetical protein
MGFYNSPRIITDNLVVALDAANVKSWSGVYSTTGGSPYGYFTGGVQPGSPYDTSVSQRIDYSSDSSTTSPKGPLTERKRMHSGTGSNSYGYLAGQLPNNTNADRIDYSNDTATALSRSDVLVDEANRRAAVGNNSYGYWGGGTPSTSKISRLDYSNDTGGGAQKGYLTVTRFGLTGTGNASYGYIGGGLGPKSTIDRIDYSNDTATAAERGPLTSGRYGVAAMGNANYGYWAGGYPENVNGTTIDRLDYASDTDTCLSKGNLSESKYWVTGTGSPTYGYLGGGREGSDPSQPNFDYTSKIERIDYSNDTATASPKGPLAVVVREVGAVSSQANGLGPSSSSTWKDMTGSGNNIDVDGPTFSGLNGGVWDFDGTNDYMSLSATTDIQAQAVDWTWECWFYVDAGASSYDYLFAYGPPHQIAWYDNQLNAWFNDTDNTSSYDVAFASGSNTVPTGQWTHGVISRIGSSWKMYINGVEKASATASFTVANSSTGPKIGSYDGSQYFLDGKIALFKIYKAKGLTASEVLQNFNATRTRFGV